MAFFDSPTFIYLVIPLLIILARIVDVSLGTVRIIFISRGYRHYAPVVGFFEILIWLLAIRQILMDLSNWTIMIAYALGFALGTYFGMLLEERLRLGKVMLRIVTKSDAEEFLDNLRHSKYVFTSIDEDSEEGKVKAIFTVVKKQHLDDVLGKVKKFIPHAFYSIEDVRYANDLPHPDSEQTATRERKFEISIFRWLRKGK